MQLVKDCWLTGKQDTVGTSFPSKFHISLQNSQLSRSRRKPKSQSITIIGRKGWSIQIAHIIKKKLSVVISLITSLLSICFIYLNQNQNVLIFRIPKIQKSLKLAKKQLRYKVLKFYNLLPKIEILKCRILKRMVGQDNITVQELFRQIFPKNCPIKVFIGK